MKFASRGDCFTIYVLTNNFLDAEIKDYVKKMVLRLKNRFRKYISGYYKAHVYINDCYGMIIDLIKEEDFDFFKDFIELDINILYDSEMYFKFNDYFLIMNKSDIFYYDDNYYVNIKKVSKREFLKLTEFGEIVYGNEVSRIKNKLVKLNIV